MTIEEIFNKLAIHMRTGINYHNDFARLYDFLGLYGFAKFQFCQQIEEEIGYCNLLHYYAKTQFKILNIDTEEKTEIIPTTWYKYSTWAVDAGTKRNTIKELMTKWVEWERTTKQLYEQMYIELQNLGETAAALYLNKYILNVTKELHHAEKELIKLETIGYDLNLIIEWQEDLYHKYKKKLRW